MDRRKGDKTNEFVGNNIEKMFSKRHNEKIVLIDLLQCIVCIWTANNAMKDNRQEAKYKI